MSTESLRTASDRSMHSGTQRRLLRKALESGLKTSSSRFDQRAAIRELCNSIRDLADGPEHLLVGFKDLLTQTANEAQLPYGPERSELLSRIVSVFIEELYGLRVQHAAPEDGASRQQL